MVAVDRPTDDGAAVLSAVPVTQIGIRGRGPGDDRPGEVELSGEFGDRVGERRMPGVHARYPRCAILTPAPAAPAPTSRTSLVVAQRDRHRVQAPGVLGGQPAVRRGDGANQAERVGGLDLSHRGIGSQGGQSRRVDGAVDDAEIRIDPGSGRLRLVNAGPSGDEQEAPPSGEPGSAEKCGFNPFASLLPIGVQHGDDRCESDRRHGLRDGRHGRPSDRGSFGHRRGRWSGQPHKARTTASAAYAAAIRSRRRPAVMRSAKASAVTAAITSRPAGS